MKKRKRTEQQQQLRWPPGLAAIIKEEDGRSEFNIQLLGVVGRPWLFLANVLWPSCASKSQNVAVYQVAWRREQEWENADDPGGYPAFEGNRGNVDEKAGFSRKENRARDHNGKEERHEKQTR